MLRHRIKRPYLEVTFRKGKPVAGYLYLPRETGTKAVRPVELRPNMLVDYAANGDPIGVELTAPGLLDLAAVNNVLRELGAAILDAEDLAPLIAA